MLKSPLIFQAEYLESPTHYSKGTLTIEETPNAIFFNFYSSILIEQNLTQTQSEILEQIPDFAFMLSDYNRMSISMARSIQITFHKQDSKVDFALEGYFKVKQILDMISRHYIILSTLENSTNFEFCSLNLKLVGFNPFGNTNMYINNEMNEKLKIISKVLPEQPIQPKVLTKEVFMNAFDEEGRLKPDFDCEKEFFNCRADDNLQYLLFDYLVQKKEEDTTTEQRIENRKARYDEYIKTKSQWQATTKIQWNFYQHLRDLVMQLEKEIQESSNLFRDSDILMQIAFNVLLTLTYFDYNHMYYNKSILHIVSAIMNIYVKAVNTDSIIFYDDSSHNLVESESIIFWAFVDLFSKHKFEDISTDTKAPRIFNLFTTVGEYFKNSRPEVLQLYRYLQCYSFLFLIPYMESFFTQALPQKDITRVFISSLCIPNFLEKFVCAILYCLADSIFKENIDTNQKFIQVFQEKLSQINVEELLAVTANIGL